MAIRISSEFITARTYLSLVAGRFLPVMTLMIFLYVLLRAGSGKRGFLELTAQQLLRVCGQIRKGPVKQV